MVISYLVISVAPRGRLPVSLFSAAIARFSLSLKPLTKLFLSSSILVNSSSAALT